jgi:hypothetical protein
MRDERDSPWSSIQYQSNATHMSRFPRRTGRARPPPVAGTHTPQPRTVIEPREENSQSAFP